MEVTEENRDASQEAKAKAMEAISDGTFLSGPKYMTYLYNLIGLIMLVKII